MEALDGHLIVGRSVSWKTKLVLVRIDPEHEERMTFFVLKHPSWFWVYLG